MVTLPLTRSETIAGGDPLYLTHALRSVAIAGGDTPYLTPDLRSPGGALLLLAACEACGLGAAAPSPPRTRSSRSRGALLLLAACEACAPGGDTPYLTHALRSYRRRRYTLLNPRLAERSEAVGGRAHILHLPRRGSTLTPRTRSLRSRGASHNP